LRTPATCLAAAISFNVEKAAMRRETFRDTEANQSKPPYHFTGELPAALAHLRDESRWVCWKYVLKGGRWTKPPINPRTGRFADVNKSAT
jgi:hypothetical protein